MPFYQDGPIRYFRFASFEKAGVRQAIFSRRGGVSPAPWKSLNFGASVGDDLERVRKNKEVALGCLGVDPGSVYDVYQVHGSEIVATDRPLAKNEAHIKADGIITNHPGLTLLMRFADCVPIFLLDTRQKAIGVVHAGWAGTVNKIAEKALILLRQHYGSQPEDILAGIGPAIGLDHYEIGDDLQNKVRLAFQDDAEKLIRVRDGKTHLDLWKANALVLHQAGVRQVEIAGICTQCHMEDWYSHRGEYGKTGRFGAVLGLV